MATSPIEIRMAHLEGAYEQISTRLGGIEDRLGRLDVKFDDRLSRLDDRIGRLEDKIEGKLSRLDTRIDSVRTELLSRMDRQFYWIFSLVVLSILVPLFLRLLSM